MSPASSLSVAAVLPSASTVHAILLRSPETTPKKYHEHEYGSEQGSDDQHGSSRSLVRLFNRRDFWTNWQARPFRAARKRRRENSRGQNRLRLSPASARSPQDRRKGLRPTTCAVKRLTPFSISLGAGSSLAANQGKLRQSAKGASRTKRAKLQAV